MTTPVSQRGDAASEETALQSTSGKAVPDDVELEDQYAGEWDEQPAVALYKPVLALVLSLAGLGDSIYVTIVHYAHVAPVCSNTGAINCEKVLQSQWSVLFGIPMPIYGLTFFVAMLVMSLPGLWRTYIWWVAWLRLAMVVVGMGFVVYLIYVELFKVKAICLWCTGVHAATFLLFVLVVSALPQTTRARADWQDEQVA